MQTPVWHVLAQAASSDQLISGTAPTPGTVAPGAPGGAPLGPAGAGGAGGGLGILFPLILVMVFFIAMTFFTARRDKKKRQSLMSSLKKGDDVLTVGGILGTIVEMTDDHVTLKIDTNSRMRVVRSAIQQNLSTTATAVNPGGAQVEVKAKNDSKEKLAV